MKYIISENQYIRLNEQEERMEFPGIDYFGGDWGIVEAMLDKLIYNGQQYSDIKDLMKAYYIDFIVNGVNPQIDIESDDNDHIAIWGHIDLFQSGVFIFNIMTDSWDRYDYEDLSIGQLESIIEEIRNCDN